MRQPSRLAGPSERLGSASSSCSASARLQLPFILASQSNITRFRSAALAARHRQSAQTKTTRDDIDLDLYQGGTNGTSVRLRAHSSAEVTAIRV
jgi:hypothetical protein